MSSAPIDRRVANVRPPASDGIDEKTYDLVLLRRLWPFAKPYARFFLATLCLVPVVTGASLVQPLLMRETIQASLVERSSVALGRVVILFGIAITVEFLARFAQQYALQLAGQRTVAAIRTATYERVQRLPLTYLDRTPVGRVVTRVTNDSDALGELFASGAVLAISDLVMLIGCLVMMFYLDVGMTLVALCAIPPLAISVDRIRRRAREAFRAIRASIAQLNAYMSEQVQGIAIVQAFGREDACLAEYEQINASHRDANLRSIRYDALLFSIVESIAAVTVAIVLWYAAVHVGGLGATESAVYVGTVVAFYDYVQRFFVPIRELSTKYTILQSSLAAAERIFALLDMKDDDAPAGLAVPKYAPGDPEVAIELRDVVFSYRTGHPVLHEVSLKVRRGERVAIVGPTGSGKTTITALALRLYDVSEGHVLVDGLDVRDVDRRALRSKFASVPQDVFLYNDTVLANVAALDPSPDVERAREALAKVGLEERLAARGGLSAKIDERGANLSAGERQLVAFARAIYLDRPFLVLDEATAHVDSETEARLGKAAEAMLAGRTAIVIAHRLSTIRSVDRIVVVHRGRIVEEGKHEELLALGGLYARLYELQLTDSAAGEEDPADGPGGEPAEGPRNAAPAGESAVS
jgi:ATP-binding cassette subfamily B multidrug efflux pump